MPFALLCWASKPGITRFSRSVRFASNSTDGIGDEAVSLCRRACNLNGQSHGTRSHIVSFLIQI